MTDYAAYSFWLQTAGEPLIPRPSLTRSLDVDVAILGAGYSGLWTAYYLLREQPGLRVAIVEKEIAGFGASGRNGGWCSPRFPVTPGMLARRFGAASARALLVAMMDSVGEVGRVCEQEGLQVDFRPSGILSVARGEYQQRLVQSAYAAYQRLGLQAHHQLLSAEELSDRVKISGAKGALWTVEGASLHPGRLVRGLAGVVERLGGSIFERTKVLRYESGSRASLITEGGELRATKALILAGEAYLSGMPQLRRCVAPMYSLISLTEPLSARQWEQIGWEKGESIASNAYSVEYLTRTSDGRVLFGGRGAPYVFGSKITDEQDRHAATHERLQNALREWFPSLSGVRFTHSWGGPVGMPRDWMPSVAFDAQTKIATARGYTGQGVSTANLAARVLCALILENDSELRSLPMAQRTSPSWEGEPLRWAAIRYMQSGYRRIDDALANNKRQPFDAALIHRLGKH